MTRSWDRLAAAGGLLGVALSLGGFAVIAASGFAAQPGASTQDISRILDEGSAGVAVAGIYIDTLGSLFFILFIARLWAALRQAEGQPAWLSVAAFGSGILMVVAGLGDKIAYYGIVLAADSDLSAEAVAPLYYIVAGSFLLFQTFGGLFLLTTGAAVLRTGALVRWLGWAGVVVGGAAIALGAVPGPGMLVFPFFVLTVAALSVALLRRPLEVGAA
ncbi:MAG TPA: hypothetical protein VGS09_04605 [Actinomycetota bacterium]|jgi:hypothetical protein|nr:hypothetical protein [Actinomycetota bacterium]